MVMTAKEWSSMKNAGSMTWLWRVRTRAAGGESHKTVGSGHCPLDAGDQEFTETQV